MKYIQLKSGKEKVDLGPQNDIDLEYNTLNYIKAVINNRPADGFTVEEMRRRFRVIGAVEKLKEGATKLELEDQDFETIKTCVNQFKWGVMAKSIMEFVDQINS
jgi:hypothetical protein